MENNNFNQQTPPPPPPNPQYQQQQQGYQNYLPPVPNATGALVLGILSIVFSFCYGIIGIVLGIIGLSLAGKATQLFEQYPGAYSQSSYNNAKAGKITSLIGLILSVIVFLYFLFILFLVGSALNNPWGVFY